MNCAVHMQGNHACPYEALYVVKWHATLDDVPRRRPVCLGHLLRALDDALVATVRLRPVVEIGYVWSELWSEDHELFELIPESEP